MTDVLQGDELVLPEYGEYFGPLFSSHLIGIAVFQTLKAWLPVYRAEILRLYGVQLPVIQSWQVVDELTAWPDMKDPICSIINSGIAKGSDPEEHSDGAFEAGWGIGVNISITHPTEKGAQRLARLYAAAVRGIILQHRSLGMGGLGAKTRWLDEGYGSLPPSQKRVKAQAENVFAVDVDQVLNWQLGPKGEPPDPEDLPVDFPEITEADVVGVEVET